ncbi:MAG: FAD-dependent oxidoreductase [Lentisphaerae bacterium]|nr:FAD-dependent oxidoreductase [Lentisphaerota bacterium]
MKKHLGWILAAVTALAGTGRTAETREADVIVYGGTSAGVIAAVQAVKMGKTAILVCPDKHLGGLSSGGLGWTDTGNKAVIGGLSREFYHRVWKHYDRADAWRWQKREEYGNKGQGTAAIDGDQRTMWIFEPHVAEAVFEDFVAEFKIRVFRDEWLDRKAGVRKEGGRIASVRMLGGNVYAGKMFIDATYEGDLMAAAGVGYHVGREANSVYGEQWNGVQKGAKHHGHYFKKPVDPYVKPGDPSSGLLPRIAKTPPGENGSGDAGVQAYCYRMCLTDCPENRIPFAKPEGYDPLQYELVLRVLATGWRETFGKFDPIPNKKTDTNNHGPFSTDNIGMNHDYPEADYDRRREILREHETYQKGWLYFLANDPRVPEDVRTEMSRWGLPKDEFADNGNWSHQIYVREARRMVGEFVMTDQHLLGKREVPQPVGMGSYAMDSHNVWRYVTPEGTVQNEGDIGVGLKPYRISYGSLVPKRGECANLLVPVCVGSSHIAYGSIRMEPVFMILGQSAATAAAMAIDAGQAVQEVDYAKLRERLLADGQVLETPPGAERLHGGHRTGVELPGIVVDDEKAELAGPWGDSHSLGTWVGNGYRHDGNSAKGECTALFQAAIPKAGRYEVRLAFPASSNRATAVPVTVRHAGGEAKATVNQRETPPIDGMLVPLGTFEFAPGGKAEVLVSNAGTKGHVVVDAVQWVPAP